MSEPIPESVPTSADPRSRRPLKKRALTSRAALAADVDALFAKPDREIVIPGSALAKTLAAPPELVANVQGSSAGAGSGEFHVYKASRRREYERLRSMDDEVRNEQEEKDFLARKAEQEKRDQDKTDKNRAKRAKALARKQKAKQGKSKDAGDMESTPAAEGTKKKLAPNANTLNTANIHDATEPDGGEVKNNDEIGLVIEDDD